jgi:hypothetical protein
MASKLAFILILSSSAAMLVRAQTDGIALTIGGFGGGTSLEVVTATKHCLGDISVPKMPSTPTGSIEGWVSEYVDNKVYLCGGSDINFRAECYSFNIGQTFWDYSGTLDDAREYSASVVLDDEMVVLGGYNDRNGWLDSVEKKTRATNDWLRMDDWKLPRKMFNFCAAAVDSTRIVVAGGNEYGKPYLDLVDVLDTVSNTWTSADPLTVGKASLGCLTVTHEGEQGLLVTGGCINNCQDHLDEVAFLSYSTLTWTALPSLNEARMGHKMAWIDGMPAVVGGYTTDLKRTIELWDGTQWVMHPQELSFGRWAFGMPSYLPKSEIACA